MKPKTPRQRVASHLMGLGFKLNEDDIVFTQGGIHKVFDDIIECWHVHCSDKNNNEVAIYSAFTLTECAKGLRIEPNTRESDLYGDYLAIPAKASHSC